MVLETNLVFDINDTHQPFAYADDNLIGHGITTTERNVDVLFNVYKGIGLAENTGKIKYMEMGRHRGMIVNENMV